MFRTRTRTTAVTAVVCVTAALLGYPRMAWGFLAGSATGALLMGGLLLVGIDLYDLWANWELITAFLS